MTDYGNLYIANKMTGIPFFNAPWFDETEEWLLTVPGVTGVFSPAAEDRRVHGLEPMSCPTGSPEEMTEAGFDVRKALRLDWEQIATRSDGLVIGPRWFDSPGTMSEIACHQALRLPVWEIDVFKAYHDKPEIMQRLMLPPLVSFIR